MRWVVYYGDRSRFTDADGPPSDAPSSRVALIARENELTGRALCAFDPHYVHHDGEWYGHDDVGLVDWLERRGFLEVVPASPSTQYYLDDGKPYDWIGMVWSMRARGIVKIGETLPNDLFRELLRFAWYEDDYLPRKSARLRGEPRPP